MLTTSFQTHKCVPFDGNEYAFAYRASGTAHRRLRRLERGPPSAFEEVVGFAKSDELLHDVDIMLEVPSTERGRGEVNLSPITGSNTPTEVGGYSVQSCVTGVGT